MRNKVDVSLVFADPIFRDMEASPEQPVLVPVSSTVSTPSTATARSQAKLGGFLSWIAKADLLLRSDSGMP